MENNIFIELEEEFGSEFNDEEELNEVVQEDYKDVFNEEQTLRNLACAILKQVCEDYVEWQRIELGIKRPLKDKKRMTEIETSGKDALFVLTIKENGWWLDLVDCPYNRRDLKKKLDEMIMYELSKISVGA